MSISCVTITLLLKITLTKGRKNSIFGGQITNNCTLQHYFSKTIYSVGKSEIWISPINNYTCTFIFFSNLNINNCFNFIPNFLRIIYCDYIATKILTKKKENQKLSLFIVQIYQGHINSSSNAQNTEISINICFQYCYFVFLKQFFTSDIDLTLSKWNPKLILINLILIILIQFKSAIERLIVFDYAILGLLFQNQYTLCKYFLQVIVL